MLLTQSAESVRPRNETALVFHRYGDHYFLFQIWTAGDTPRLTDSEVVNGAWVRTRDLSQQGTVVARFGTCGRHRDGKS